MKCLSPFRSARAAMALVSAAIFLLGAGPARADALDDDVTAALQTLYKTSPVAAQLGPKAKAILVFPDVVKAGFIWGAQYGEGTMVIKGKNAGNYMLKAASYGLQAGVQSFGFAMFLMTDEAVKYLQESQGWELGSGPSIVVVDEGAAKTMSTSTLQKDIYAFTFGQKGLMGGLGLQGTKITKTK